MKDVEEPVRIFYDCGLGRDFIADELAAEQAVSLDAGNWRVLRARNKWQSAEECARHPVPGTFPVVVTENMDWGGWRVPAAEYDRDPERIETQARMIANAPRLVELAEHLADLSRSDPEMAGPLSQLVRQCQDVLRDIQAQPAAKPGKSRDAA